MLYSLFSSLLLSLSVSAAPSVNMVAASWFGGWHAVPGLNPSFTVSDINWSKFTSISYAFAITTDDENHIALLDSDKQILPSFVKAAHANHVEARISYGGWGGSQFFSYAFAPANRTATIKAMLNLVAQYGLDGIDFDWEYPNSPGIGCNVVSSADTANFLATLQQLRKDPVGAKLTLTAAVVGPFVGPNGTPETDLSGFASALDYIEIMNYDIHGNWSTGLGPNAPLNDACAAPSQQQGSATSLVNAWNAAGFPSSKIVLGVAAYGHSVFVPKSEINTASTLAQYPAFIASRSQGAQFGDTWTNTAGLDQCGNPVAAGGTMEYWGLMQNGFLTNSGSPASGIEHAFDECSQTDYVYNPSTQVAVSYDSTKAFAAKGAFIKQKGLRGFSMWEAGGDFQNQLVDSIRTATGLKSGAAQPVSVANHPSTPSSSTTNTTNAGGSGVSSSPSNGQAGGPAPQAPVQDPSTTTNGASSGLASSAVQHSARLFSLAPLLLCLVASIIVS